MSITLSREEYLKKKRNKKLFRLGMVMTLLIFLVGSASYIAHRPKIRISKVDLTGGVLVSGSEIEAKALDRISGSYFWLFPKNVFFLYPKGDLGEYLKDMFKRIDTIHIYRSDFRTIVVEITERKPIATWCGIEPLEVGELESCHFLDSNATVFAEAPSFSGDVYFKYYGPVTSDVPIGSYYIASTTEFEAISQFVGDVKSLGLKPIYIVSKDEGEFRVVLASGGQIVFDTKEPLTKVSANLEALLQTPALSQNISNLDYIDLRFGNKLFYKLK